MAKLPIEHKYLKNTKQNAYANPVWNKKGTEYICVTVADKYQFYFTSSGKTLVEIDDLSTGSWDVYSGKETKEWLEYKGSMEVYTKSVLPTLKSYLKKYPTKK